LFGRGWDRVGFVDFEFELLEKDQIGGVEAADLFVVPEQVLEFAVGVEGVDLELVLLLGKAIVQGAVVGALGCVGGILGGVVADGTVRSARSAEGCNAVVWVAPEATLIDDEDQIGFAAGAAQGIATPDLDSVLDVEDGIAGLGVEGDIGDVAGVAVFHVDGFGVFEDFGEAGMFRLPGCESSGGQEHQKNSGFADHSWPRLAGGPWTAIFRNLEMIRLLDLNAYCG